MASPAQIAANRANAQKSTGPRTLAGKQRASLSALKHGLTAQTLVLPHEEPFAFGEIREQLYEQYQPATPQESMLVDQLTAAWWRTIRVRQIETDMFDLQIKTLNRKHPQKETSKQTDRQALAVRFVTESEKDFRNFMRYDSNIERAFYRALNTLEKLQAARRRDEAAANDSQISDVRSEPRRAREQALSSLPVTPTIHTEIGFVSHPVETPAQPTTFQILRT
jgi:hypothetical protein